MCLLRPPAARLGLRLFDRLDDVGSRLRRVQGRLARGSRFAARKIRPSGASLTMRPRLLDPRDSHPSVGPPADSSVSGETTARAIGTPPDLITPEPQRTEDTHGAERYRNRSGNLPVQRPADVPGSMCFPQPIRSLPTIPHMTERHDLQSAVFPRGSFASPCGQGSYCKLMFTVTVMHSGVGIFTLTT